MKTLKDVIEEDAPLMWKYVTESGWFMTNWEVERDSYLFKMRSDDKLPKGENR